MPGVTHLSTPPATPHGGPLPAPGGGWEDAHMQVHTFLIVGVFCMVCFLLLLTFLYTFCFHCSIADMPKEPPAAAAAAACSLDREDATFRRSSSDGLGNVV